MATKEEVYGKSTMGQQTGFGKRPAIVVIDFQKGFTHEDFAGTGSNMFKECKATKRLTDAAREKDIKIFYCRVGYHESGIEGGVFEQKVNFLKEFTKDSWFYEWDDNLDVRDEDICFEKHWPSAFFGTHLAQMLTFLHIDTVMLCGCTMSGCVNASAIDSVSHGFKTILVKDAIADRNQEVYDVFLFNASYKYADVHTVDECIGKISELEKIEY